VDSRSTKGANPNRVHPSVRLPERLSGRHAAARSSWPHRWASRTAGAALQSSMHERSSCLSVSGGIAPSAAAAPLSPIRAETITRDEPWLQAVFGGRRGHAPERAGSGVSDVGTRAHHGGLAERQRSFDRQHQPPVSSDQATFAPRWGEITKALFAVRGRHRRSRSFAVVAAGSGLAPPLDGRQLADSGLSSA